MRCNTYKKDAKNNTYRLFFFHGFFKIQVGLNPEFAVAIYYGLKILAPTARFAAVFCASLRYLLQNLGLKVAVAKFTLLEMLSSRSSF